MNPRERVWRWLILPAVLLYAVLTWGSGIDRAAGDLATGGVWTPPALHSGTSFVEARRFVEAGIPGSALDPARAALLSEPVNPAAPALLGMALLGKRNMAAADQAFRVAARLGWREPLTQLYWFQTSLAQNDLNNAVLRFDAIARQHPDAPYIGVMARSLERSSAGRDALARRLVAGANWTGSYATIRDGTTSEQIAARVDVLNRVADLGRQIGCESMVQPARVLAAVDPAAGARLWRRHCPRAAGQGLVIDGGFEQPVLASLGTQVPFEWSVTGYGGLDAGLAPVKGGQAVQVRSSSSVTLPFIEQLVPLQPGTYRLSWRIEEPGSEQQRRLLASLSCARDLVAAQPQAGMPLGDRLTRQISIPADCKAPWLRLWLAPGSADVTVDDLRVEPI